MIESIKEFLCKSSNGLMSMIITDVNTIVLIRKVFEIDQNMNPPVVIEKDSEVATVISLGSVDRAIADYTDKINDLNLFKQKVISVIEPGT